MKGSIAKILTFLDRSREFTEAVTDTAADTEQRAARLALTLAALWPTPLSACLLLEGDCSAVRVHDDTGARRPEWEAWLQKELNHWAGQGQPGELATVSLPQALGLPNYLLGVAPLAHGDHRYGCLAVGLPKGQRSQNGMLARLVLARQAEHLGLLLNRERPPAPGLAQPARPENWAWLNDFADLAYLVSHEFNNFLNNLLLHVSVVELKSGGPVGSDLAAVRQLGMELAAKIQQFQQLTRMHRPLLEPVDLNELVRAAVPAAGSLPVHLDLVDDLPAVLGTAWDLKHLAELLVADAAAALALAGGSITLRSQRANSYVQLRVEDTGPSISEAELARLLEPFSAVRPGSDGLRLAICRAVARRLQGNIHVDSRPGGGLTVTVDLRVAAP
jgi:signal transduction histidine kinase